MKNAGLNFYRIGFFLISGLVLLDASYSLRQENIFFDTKGLIKNTLADNASFSLQKSQQVIYAYRLNVKRSGTADICFEPNLNQENIEAEKVAAEFALTEPRVLVAGAETEKKVLPTSVARKPLPPKPVRPNNSGMIASGISAGVPFDYKKDSLGRMVCRVNNDHPSKSKKGKSVHIDMECCLDPDEVPNPHCYYPPEKYGNLINRYNAEKKDEYLKKIQRKK